MDHVRPGPHDDDHDGDDDGLAGAAISGFALNPAR